MRTWRPEKIETRQSTHPGAPPNIILWLSFEASEVIGLLLNATLETQNHRLHNAGGAQQVKP